MPSDAISDSDTVTYEGLLPETPPGGATIGDLLAMPEGSGDRYELINGRIVRKPVAGGSHDYFAYRLVLALGAYVDTHHLGAITLSQAGYQITLPGATSTVYIPDLAFVRTERVPAEDSQEWSRFWPLAPDLVVEVVSPSQSQPEMRQRAHDWLNAGSRLVWLLWPASKRIDAYYAEEVGPPPKIALQQYHVGDMLDGRDVVPGFSHPVAEIFKGVR